MALVAATAMVVSIEIEVLLARSESVRTTMTFGRLRYSCDPSGSVSSSSSSSSS